MNWRKEGDGPLRGLEVEHMSIEERLEFLMWNEDHDQDQPFETVGMHGRHVVAYNLGGGVCARLHFAKGMATAIKDRENHIAIASDGLPVPFVRSTIFKTAWKAVFAVDLINGYEQWDEGSAGDRRNSYEQIIRLMELALERGWSPHDWRVSGNLLKENASGRIVAVDLTDWVNLNIDRSKRVGEEAWIRQQITGCQNLLNGRSWSGY